MKKTIVLFSAALALTLIAACKKNTTTTTPITTKPCTKIWTVLKTAAKCVDTVTGSYLEMNITGCKTTEMLNIYKQTLTGDFTAIAHFQDFAGATGAGGYGQFVVSDPALLDSGIVVAGIGSGLISSKVGNYKAVVTSCPNTYGTMTITRAGNIVTSTLVSDAYTATSTHPWRNTSLNIGFQIGTNINDLTGLLRLRILDVKVTATAGVWVNDTFDCSSLK